MEFLVAVDKNFAIGRGGQLLFRVPEDMSFFRRTTTGHTVVMGRRTFESLPGQKPLPDRTNMVLTKNRNFTPDGVIAVHDVGELASRLKTHGAEKVFLIGGAALYETLLPYCDGGYITFLEAEADRPDRFFPNLKNDPAWVCERLVTESETSDITFKIYYFRNQAVKNLEDET